MSLTRNITAIFLLLLITSANNAFAGSKYVIDGKNSIVNFSTIKKQYVIEPAVFDNVKGSISSLGEVEIIIDLSSVNTSVLIRDTRIQDLFFKIVKFPQATIKAKIDMKKLKSISYYKQMEIPAILNFYGTSKEIKLDVLIAKVYRKKLLITSMKPIIINANDYGIPAKNLIDLSQTVAGISLSSKAAVNFVLSFKHNK
ncbi:MAG: YceI family protein [Gammaproteobacteria bacterium]|nr:YceI family protein [Gammaproteobacteria bacterium]